MELSNGEVLEASGSPPTFEQMKIDVSQPRRGYAQETSDLGDNSGSRRKRVMKRQRRQDNNENYESDDVPDLEKIQPKKTVSKSVKRLVEKTKKNLEILNFDNVPPSQNPSELARNVLESQNGGEDFIELVESENLEASTSSSSPDTEKSEETHRDRSPTPNPSELTPKFWVTERQESEHSEVNGRFLLRFRREACEMIQKKCQKASVESGKNNRMDDSESQVVTREARELISSEGLEANVDDSINSFSNSVNMDIGDQSESEATILAAIDTSEASEAAQNPGSSYFDRENGDINEKIVEVETVSDVQGDRKNRDEMSDKAESGSELTQSEIQETGQGSADRNENSQIDLLRYIELVKRLSIYDHAAMTYQPDDSQAEVHRQMHQHVSVLLSGAIDKHELEKKNQPVPVEVTLVVTENLPSTSQVVDVEAVEGEAEDEVRNPTDEDPFEDAGTDAPETSFETRYPPLVYNIMANPEVDVAVLSGIEDSEGQGSNGGRASQASTIPAYQSDFVDDVMETDILLEPTTPQLVETRKMSIEQVTSSISHSEGEPEPVEVERLKQNRFSIDEILHN